MTSATNVARKLANQLWGDVDTQEKVLDGIWHFSCTSHSGYILDLDVYPQYEDIFERFRKHVQKSMGSDKYMYSEQHFVAFEEDCDYAVLEFVLFDDFVKVRFENADLDSLPQADREDIARWKLRLIGTIQHYYYDDILINYLYEDFIDTLSNVITSYIPSLSGGHNKFDIVEYFLNRIVDEIIENNRNEYTCTMNFVNVIENYDDETYKVRVVIKGVDYFITDQEVIEFFDKLFDCKDVDTDIVECYKRMREVMAESGICHYDKEILDISERN